MIATASPRRSTSYSRSPLHSPENSLWRKRTTSTRRKRAKGVSMLTMRASGCAGGGFGARRGLIGALGSREDLAVEDGIGRSGFDLDDPEIGVAAVLARDISVRLGFRHRRGAGRAHPHQRAVRLAGLREHRKTRVTAVQLQENRPGVGVTAREHRDADRGEIAAADQRPDPYAALEPRLHASGSRLRTRQLLDAGDIGVAMNRDEIAFVEQHIGRAALATAKLGDGIIRAHQHLYQAVAQIGLARRQREQRVAAAARIAEAIFAVAG